MKVFSNRTQQVKSIKGLFESKSCLYCGANKDYHRFVPELSITGMNVDVVEIIPSHCEWCKSSGLFKTVINRDIASYTPFMMYDSIVMMHIVEHLSLSQAIDVVNRLKNYCNLLVVAVPWGAVPAVPAGKQVDFPSDNHLTQWIARDLSQKLKLKEISVVGTKGKPGSQIVGVYRHE